MAYFAASSCKYSTPTDLSVGEIAKAVGYERSDSFSSYFSRITGLLPTEYRELEPVFIRNVCGFSSIILLQTRQKSAGVLPHGKDF